MTLNQAKTVIFVTGNINKLEEVNKILGSSAGFKYENRNLDLAEYQGEIDDICRKKCQDAFQLVKGPVLVEDTCLCFDEFGDLPGPYIKWFLRSLGPAGLYRLLADFPNKSARAVCTFGYMENEDKPVKLFQGVTQGTIVYPQGSTDFGWDPCFQPSGFNKTYAEMTKDEKNVISHRGKALLKLKQYFENKANLNVD